MNIMRLFSILLCCILCCSFSIQAQNVLSLQQAVELALKHNYDILLAKNQSDIQSIENSWANAGAYPTVNAGLTTNYSQFSINQELSNGQTITGSGVTQQNTQAFVTLSWRVFDGMRMFATKSRLEEVQKSGELQLKQQVMQTMYDVCMAYYGLARLTQQQKTLDELIRVLEERLRLAEARLSVGVGTKNDVLQAKIDINEQQSARLTVQNSLAQLTASLNILLGRNPSAIIGVEDSIPLGAQPDFTALQNLTEQQNYSTLIAQQELAIALQQKSEIYAQGLPSITFNTGYNYNYNQNSRGLFVINANNGFTAGIGISVPLFNGLITHTQLATQDMLIQNRRLQLDALQQQVRQLYTNASTNYTNAMATISIEKNNNELAKENAEIAMERFKRQSITTPELRQAQYSIIESATRLFNAQFTAKAAELQLQLLAGTLKVQ